MAPVALLPSLLELPDGARKKDPCSPEQRSPCVRLNRPRRVGAGDPQPISPYRRGFDIGLTTNFR